MNDEEIARLVQQGEKERYREIVDRYEKRLLGYVRRMTNQPREEVEDIVQEVLIAGYENIWGFDYRKSFGGWIFRIAHNKVIDYFRRRKPVVRERDVGNEGEIGEEWLENLPDKGGLIEELAIKKEEGEMVARLVGELEVKYREVIMLYFFEEKSYEEISDILRVPVGNVGVLLYRAKEKLRNKLKYDG